jgi:secreted Zn-dependent insulinase-like peptidase
MGKYKVGCVWTMYGSVEVEADTIEEAMEKAHDPYLPLPENGVYLEDSFDVDYETTERIGD